MRIFSVIGSFATKLRCRLIECSDILVIDTEIISSSCEVYRNISLATNFETTFKDQNAMEIVQIDLARDCNLNFGKI